MLFDVGLHFSLKIISERSRDIFAFGPIQVLFATIALNLLAHLVGLEWGAATLVGAVLSMSSTAIGARLIAERHQQGCPVGQTATAILIFQDVAAIFVLIVASSIGSSQGIAMVASFAFVDFSILCRLFQQGCRILVCRAASMTTETGAGAGTIP